MRLKNQRYLKTLTLSASLLMALWAMLFFFCDDPLQSPSIEAEALASETEPTWESMSAPEVEAQPERPALPGANPAQIQWGNVLLDREQVHLTVLQKPLQLAGTKRRMGSEAFDYAAYVFDQIAHEVQNTRLSSQFKRLGMEARILGHALRSAGEIRFDGKPGEEMKHLMTRNALLSQVIRLNASPLVTVDYDNTGRLLTEEKTSARPGETMETFLSDIQSVLKSDTSRHYPETMKLVREEGETLSKLAQHLTLRWESTLNHSQNVVSHMRIYAHQTLPPESIVTASL